jgi:hypothetical protein
MALMFAACADRRYVQENPPQNASGKSTYDCELAFAQSGVCVSYKWEKLPSEKDPGQMVFRLFTLDGLDGFPQLYGTDQGIVVEIWMPAMGHGSAPVTVERLKDGTYRATNMYFIMPGEWEIRFQISNGDTVIDEALATYTL